MGEEEEGGGRDDFASGLLERARRSLHQSLSMRLDTEEDDSDNSDISNSDANSTEASPTAALGATRAVVAVSRTAQANQFHEGEEHVGEVAQVVRGKFGFIVAETTGTSRRVLKQKIFFHMKDAPADVRIGDRMKFMVMRDPYNKGKMIAKEMSITKKAAPDLQHAHRAGGLGGSMLRDATSSYNNGNSNSRGYNYNRNRNCEQGLGGKGNHDGNGGRADSDNNWRRGFGSSRGNSNEEKSSS